MSDGLSSLKLTLEQMKKEDRIEDQLRADTYIQQLHDEIQRLADRVAQLERHPKFAMVGGAGGLSSKSIADLGTKDHDLLDGLLDDDHTQYELAAATRGDSNIGANSLKTTNLLVYELDANTLNIANHAKTLNKNLQLYEVKPHQVRFRDINGLLQAAYVNDAYIRIDGIHTGVGYQEVARVVGAAAGASFAISRADDITMLDGKFPIFDKASGNGIKVDTTTPTFGWRDLLGEIRTRGVGATDPNDAVYDGANIRAYQFAVNDECWINFHIPHDYVAGTDIHLHFHWSHNGTLVTGGNVTWGADVTYAKGHNQAPFPASVNTTVVGNASTTQYQHMITEVKISDSAPGASEIDTDNLEPDGVLMVRGYLSANNITVSGGAVPDPFLHYMDIHYQSTNIATKAKVPDFYT